MKKISVKKYLKIGSIIQIKIGYSYKVIELYDRKFKCILLDPSSDVEFIQEFYYNIDMTVFNEVIKNY